MSMGTSGPYVTNSHRHHVSIKGIGVSFASSITTKEVPILSFVPRLIDDVLMSQLFLLIPFAYIFALRDHGK